jgi:Ca2+/Na+ antiporter
MLNVERFLALRCPFFHQASVTKARLLYFQAFLTVITFGLMPAFLYSNAKMFVNIVAAVFLSLLLFVFIYLNYEMFKIAKSKREDQGEGERVAPTTTTSTDENRKKRILNLKIFLHVLWQLAVLSFVPAHK